MEQEKSLIVHTRPEIRKGCLWDIGLIFSKDFVAKHPIKDLYLEKPRVYKEGSAYLCLKVRSKILDKEVGFNKVAEVEKNISSISINETGTATLKVKFTQRPRAVFHKHSDVMILVVTVKSCHTNEVLTIDEHELVFRGGTGSVHSADSRKRQYVTTAEPDSSNSSDSETLVSPPKKVFTEDIFDMRLGHDYQDYHDHFDYYGTSADLAESLELEEWARQYGIDTPLGDSVKFAFPNHVRSLETDNTVHYPTSTPQMQSIPDFEASLRKLKEEIQFMVNQKLEEFASTMYDKLESQRKDLESQIMYSTVLLTNNKLGDIPTKLLHNHK